MASMGDYQRIVDGIRLFLQSGDRTLTPAVQKLATEYAQVSQEVNERLRKCQEFLRQNLRSEATHLAEAEPRLLNAYELLDFPERGEWESVLADYGLSAPGLLSEVAQELNDAYSTEEPLKFLLRRHRRFALRRAPLAERLSILRDIAAADPNTLFWEDDVRAYEQARMEELSADLKRMNNDPAGLTSLLAEVESPAWRNPPNETLVKSVRAAAQKVARGSAREELQRLTEPLLQAHRTGDFSNARRLRDAWRKQQAVAALSSSDSVMVSLQPVWHWLDEEDRRAAAQKEWQKAIQKLESALAEPGEVDTARLKKLSEAVGRFEFGLPADLGTRVQARIAGAVRSTQRKSLAVAGLIAAIVGSGLLVVVIIVFSQWSGGQLREAKAHVKDLLERNQVEEADAYFQQLSSGLQSSMVAERTEIQSRKKAAGDTQATFQMAMDQARRSLKAGNDPARFLQTAKRLASTEGEQSQIEILESQWAQEKDSGEKQRNERFLAGLQSLSPQISEVENRIQSGAVVDADSQLAKIEQSFLQIKKDRGRVAAGTPKEADEFEKRLQSLRTTVARHKLIHDAEGALTQAADKLGGEAFSRNLPRYEAALKALVEAVAGSSRETALKTALAEANAWAGVAKWNDLRANWRPLATNSPTQAQLRYGEVVSCLTEFAPSPERAVVESYRDYLAAVARREFARPDSPTPPGATEALQKVFEREPLTVWLMFETKDGKRHYTLSKRTVDANAQFSFKSVAEKTITLSGKDLRNLSTVDAPQKALSKKVTLELTRPIEDRWEDALVDVMQIVLKAEDVDALLRHQLIKSAMATGSTGSVALTAELLKLEQDWVAKRKAAGITAVDTTASWFDPDDAHGNAMREAARKSLQLLPDLAKVPPAVRALNEGLKLRWQPRHDPLGWLTKNDKGEWVCAGNALGRLKSAASEGLYVAVPDARGQAYWKQVGDVREGQPRITATADDFLVEGRLVFHRIDK